MNLNKRYSIRKLSVGVASVAIGFFISTNTDLMTSIGKNISHIAYAEEVVKEWRPEGAIIANGIDGIHWKLYENGYLEFSPSERNPRMTGVTKETGSETVHKPSWHQHADKIKAIGFTRIAYAPEDSSYLFSNLPNLEYIDTKKLQLVYPDKVHFQNTKAVTNIDYMFHQDRKLKSLDLSNWDVSNVRSMIRTFDGMRNLKNLNVSNWNTGKVTTMKGLFAYTRELQDLNISQWDVSHVTDFSSMFEISAEDDNSFNSLDISNWDTRSLVNANRMFWGRQRLTSIDLSRWNTENLESINLMLSGVSLKHLDVGNWNTTKLKTASYFIGGSKIESVNLTNWNTTNLIGDTLFRRAINVKEITIGKNFANNSTFLFKPLDNYEQPQNIYTKIFWKKADGSSDVYTRLEWEKAFKASPESLSGTWIREKVGYRVNFHTGTSETINSIEEAPLNQTILLQSPRTPDLFHNRMSANFLGWSKTINGPIITEAKNLGETKSVVELYAQWEIQEYQRQRTTMTTVYRADNTLANGQIQEEAGYDGEKEIITTYIVHQITGGEPTNPRTRERTIAEMRPKVIKIGTKPTVEYIKKNNDVVKKVTVYNVNIETGAVTPSVTETIHNANGAKDKVEYIKKNNSLVKRTTHYDVNLQTGAVTPSSNVQEETVSPSTLGNENITSLADKIEYVKQGNDVIKRTTTYDVNIETGKITPQVTDVIYNQGGTTPKVEYIKRGNDIVKQTTNYDVNPQNGEVTPNQNIAEETVSPTSLGNENITSLEDRVEYFKQGNNVMKRVTTYNVDLHTGKVTPNVTETIRNENGAKDKVEYIKKENNLVKRITHYDVDINTGNITPNSNVIEEVVQPSSLGNENITSLADKIEYVKQGNDVIKRTTTYDVNINTGKVTPQVTDETYNQGGITPKVEYIKRGNDIVKQTTNYDVNPQNGEITPNQNIVEETVSPSSLGNENIDTLADKVEYFKQGNNVMKRVTTYDVDLHTGKVTPNITETVHSENGAKDKVEYIKKENNLVKKTTHYDVDINTGNVTPNSHIDEENIEPSSLGNENITSLADKIEYVKQGNDVIKRTTRYEVNIETGKVTPQVTDETYNQGGITPKVEYIKRGNEIVKQTTNYNVNSQNGEITPNQNIVEETVSPASLGNENIDSLEDKIEYFKQGNNVMKRVTIYDVDLHTGKVTPNITETVYSENGAKDKIEYIKKENNLVKRITHYDVDTHTGNVTPNSNVEEENIQPSALGNENITSLADKIEYIKQDNDVIKRTTRYDVNVETGKVTPNVTEETYSQGETTTKIEYIKRGNEIVKRTTEFEVDITDGTLKPNSVEEVVTPASLGNNEINNVGDKVEYIKKDGDIIKKTITYDVNISDGSITPVETEVIYAKDGADDSIEYIKRGNDIIKQITEYEVDRYTGEVTPKVREEVYIKDGVKEKVEFVKENGNVIKQTTKYDVDVHTGNVIPHTESEVHNPVGLDNVNDKVEYVKQGNEIIKRITKYEVDITTGNVTPSTTEENVTPNGNGNIEDKVEFTKQGNEIVKSTTTFIVDEHTGNITPTTKTEIVTPASLGNNEIDNVGDKVEYVKKDGDIIKKITKYDVNILDGSITPVETEVIYAKDGADDSIEYIKRGNDIIKQITEYEVDKYTGEATPKVREEVYVKDGVKDKVEFVKENGNVIKQITKYDVDVHTGHITSHIEKETHNPQGLDSVNDKVEYVKQGDTIVKREIKYDVDIHTGNVTPIVSETTLKNNDTDALKDKVEYVKKGNDIVKVTTIVTVEPDTGLLQSETIETVHIKDGADDSVTYIKRGNDVIKQVTKYEVDKYTGEVTSTIIEEIVQKDSVKDKVEYVKRGNEIVKQITTYKVNKDTGEITSEVKIDEKVDSLTTSIEENGNTQKQLSSNIDKSLISNKENTKAIDENVLVTNDSNIQNNDESLMNRKENQELPKTNALYSTSYILGLLLSVVGLKQNKKD